MKVTDLRLGNIISDENNNTCKVYSVNNDCVIAKYLNVGSALGGIEAFKPIPITEEWLVNFGFKETYKSDFTATYDLEVDDKFSAKKNSVVGLAIVYLGVYIKVNYVHQLQNLYHSLTGEELTIKTK